MDHEVDDPLGDPLDRDLEALLAVEPPAEFLARVRTRVATETIGRWWRMVPRGWSFQPLLAAGVAGIVLAVVIPAWLRPEAPAVVEPRVASTVPAPPQPERIRLQPDTPGGIDGRGASTPVVVRSVRPQLGREIRIQAARPVQADTPPFAEVLFSDDERLALLTLVAAVEAGRVPPLPAVAAVEEVLPEGTAMTIEPLVIDPLPQIARLEE